MEDYNLVDLGLPSGTLWMDRNVGASSPEDAVLYFAWGETTGYTADEVGKTKQFSWDDYKFDSCNSSKYNSIDGLTSLDSTDDAAYQYTDGKYKIPSNNQIKELLDNTTSTWTTQNGVSGRLFTSKTNGNSIFVPADGYTYYNKINAIGSFGYLWGSSLSKDYYNNACCLYFNSSVTNIYYVSRCNGFSIRGVINGKNWLKRREKLLQEPLFKPLIHIGIDDEK